MIIVINAYSGYTGCTYQSYSGMLLYGILFDKSRLDTKKNGSIRAEEASEVCWRIAWQLI